MRDLRAAGASDLGFVAGVAGGASRGGALRRVSRGTSRERFACSESCAGVLAARRFKTPEFTDYFLFYVLMKLFTLGIPSVLQSASTFPAFS